MVIYLLEFNPICFRLGKLKTQNAPPQRDPPRAGFRIRQILTFVRMTATISVILNLIQNQLDPVLQLTDCHLTFEFCHFHLFFGVLIGFYFEFNSLELKQFINIFSSFFSTSRCVLPKEDEC